MFYSFIEEKPLDFPSGNLWEHEWVWVELHSHKEGRGGGTTRWAASHSPIKGGWGLSLLHSLVPPPFSSPAAPFHGRSLGEALSVGFFTTPHRRVAVVPGILYFRCPTGSRERESSSSWTCDRSRRHRRIAVHIFFVLRSAWVRLRQQQDSFS